MRPIQLNSAALYCAPGERSASSSAAVWVMTPSAVPSLGAAENRKLAARKPPLPGIDWAITVGSPGMCRPMKRATSRP